MDNKPKELLDVTYNLSTKPAREYSPLALAYIGDGVYEMFVRTYVIRNGNAPVNKLHRASRELVMAKTQASLYHVIEPHLTEAEQDVLRRGRNAKSISTPKNGDVREYRHATGLEALIGYLYLDGQIQRISELMAIGFNHVEQQMKEEK